MSRFVLANAYCLAGEPGRALPLAQEAAGRARQLGDDVLLAQCLGAHAWAVGAAASGPVLAEAIACTERSGDVGTRVGLHSNAGWNALERGDIPAARAHLEAAIRDAEAIGVPNPYPIENLGWVLRAEHDPGGARSRFDEALRTGRRTGDKAFMAGPINGLACLAADLGDWHRAAVLDGAAHALLDATGHPWEELEARYRRDSLDQVCARLGQQQFEQAHATGMALGLGQVIDLALGEDPPGT